MTIKRHSFALGRYRIYWCRVEACTDVPEGPHTSSELAMLTPPVVDFHTFALAMHEAEHADGIPDSIIHDKGGYPIHGGRHRFAWRIIKELLNAT